MLYDTMSAVITLAHGALSYYASCCFSPLRFRYETWLLTVFIETKHKQT